MKRSFGRLPVTFAASMLILGVATSLGCSSGEARTTVVSQPPGAQEDYKLVRLDDDFAGKLAVEKVIRRRTEDGFLQVQVTLVSTTSKPLPIETSWEWYDRDNFRVDGGRDAWIPTEIGARTTKEMRGIAPKPGVESFKFHVRASMPITGEN